MQANVEETALLASNHTDLPPHVLKELATKSETVTPWWWGLKTLIKVGRTGIQCDVLGLCCAMLGHVECKHTGMGVACTWWGPTMLVTVWRQ